MSDNNYLTLNKSQILEYQKNRPPYLMIDEATEVIPGLSAKGFKYLNENEWFFEVHWVHIYQWRPRFREVSFPGW